MKKIKDRLLAGGLALVLSFSTMAMDTSVAWAADTTSSVATVSADNGAGILTESLVAAEGAAVTADVVIQEKNAKEGYFIINIS